MTYRKSGHIIKQIYFTPREIDVVCFVLSGRLSKTIAVSLGITPKTLETHLRNIMRKIRCNSREAIINFFESSDIYDTLKNRYVFLMTIP